MSTLACPRCHSSLMALPWPPWGRLPRLPAAPRTREEPSSRSGSNGRQRCGRAAPAEVTDSAGLNTQELVPGAAVHSDTQLDDAVRCGPRQFRGHELGGCDKTELPVNHLAGTCRLAASIGEGVADLRLRVHGVSGLRIADASVMPRPPSGNTHATCMMIGERAAAFMLDEFSQQDKARAQVPA